MPYFLGAEIRKAREPYERLCRELKLSDWQAYGPRGLVILYTSLLHKIVLTDRKSVVSNMTHTIHITKLATRTTADLENVGISGQ